jgi:hypothetical protein
MELYYELPLKSNGKALEEDSSEYRALIKLQEELNNKFQNDMSVL